LLKLWMLGMLGVLGLLGLLLLLLMVVVVVVVVVGVLLVAHVGLVHLLLEVAVLLLGEGGREGREDRETWETREHHRRARGDGRAAGEERQLGAEARPGLLGGFRRPVADLAVLLRLHAPVLEPDLNLALGQAERMRDLDAALAGQVAVVVELLLELEGLEAGVRLSRTLLSGAIEVRCCCNVQRD
jgi:hypothetical protein